MNRINQNWWLKVATEQTNIRVSFEHFHETVWPKILNIVAWSEQQHEKNLANPPNPQQIASQLSIAGYPQANEILTALDHQNAPALSAASARLIEWTRNLIQGQYDQRVVDAAFNATRAIHDYVDILDGHGPYTLQQAKRDYAETVRVTKRNMQQLSSQIYQAINRIPNWHSSPVVIFARPIETIEGVDWTRAGEDAYVEVANAGFTLFVNENDYHIDDVLDAGDPEFFTNPNVQEDYFSLIKELKNPGSSQQAGKTLRLYTARPVRDRQIYMNADKIPPNIFLTTNYSRAEGIAMDLSGSEETRDIWQILIDDRYLVQKEHYEDYQVVGTQPVPVKNIKLISPGAA